MYSTTTPHQGPATPGEDAGALGGAGRILLGVFEALERAGVAYCVLHGYEGYPWRIGTDVDLIVPAALRPRQIVALLRENRDRIGAEVVGAGSVRRSGCYVTLAGKEEDG